MHEGVVLRDANGVIVYVNAAAERILRRTRAELVGGKSVNSGGVREDGTPFLPSGSVSSTALATGRDAVEELIGLQVDDGELRWFSVNARVLRDGDVVTGVLSTFVDVTDHRTWSTRWPRARARPWRPATRCARCSTRRRSTRSSAPTPTA